METAWVQELLTWIGDHPNWAAAFAFFTGLLEAIFVFGLLVPGAVLLFGLGALVATGAMELWPTIFWAVSGALIGDHLSYLLGYKLRGGLKNIWPIKNYPALLERGEDFFSKHGGKGIVLGRFIGALRPIMPTVAGAAGMRPVVFSIMDSVSMVPWILAYMMPGVIFGASLNLAAEIGSRLLIMLIVAAVVVWLFIWIARRVFLYVSRHAETLTINLLNWSQSHRRLGLLGASLTDPKQPETPGLAILATLLMAGAWLAYSLLWNTTEPAALDALVYQLFQSLQNPIADNLTLGFAALAGWQVYLPVAVVVFLSLVVNRRFLAAAHWMAALSFGAVLAFGLDWLVDLPEPVQYYRDQQGLAFNGSHLILSTVVYGFLAVLLATGKADNRRWRYYGVSVAAVVLIAIAQLYLGAQWLSDVILGISIGTIWVSLLTLGYRRHAAERVASLSLMPITVTIALLACLWHWQYNSDGLRDRYRPSPTAEATDLRSWQYRDFSGLPAYRTDLMAHRRYPLTVQWSGPIDAIAAQLKSMGWKSQEGSVLHRSLLWLSPSAGIDQLALTPQYHGGSDHKLAMLLPIDNDQQWVLRLWRSELSVDNNPIWIGSVARYRSENTWRYLRIPTMSGDFVEGRDLLRKQIQAGRLRVHPKASGNDTDNWDRRVLLLNTRLRTN